MKLPEAIKALLGDVILMHCQWVARYTGKEGRRKKGEVGCK